MKKNILFVVDERQLGGVSILLNDILHNINIKKYNIDVAILHNNGDHLNNLPKTVNIIYGTPFFKAIDLTTKEALKSKSITTIFSKIRIVFMMKTGLITKKIIKERKKMFDKTYDVEIAFKDGFCAIFTAYGNSRKKYHWLQIDYSMYDCNAKYQKLFKKVFPKFDKMIAISNSVLKNFKEKYQANKTDVIFNIIDTKKIINSSMAETIEYNKKHLNLITVGRIHNSKGYDRLIDIMHKLDEENKLKDVTLRIIGDGPDYELIKNKIDAYHLEDKIILLGKKNNPYPYVKASDCYILSSRHESFGLVVLEALILKVPVLATEVASIKEIMDENYGFIVKNNDEELYNGILKIINDRKILNEKKNNLKNYNYDIKSIIKQIEDLLDE